MGRRCVKLTFELKSDTHRGIRNKALALISSRFVFLLAKSRFLSIKILIGGHLLNESENSNRISPGLFALADVDR